MTRSITTALALLLAWGSLAPAGEESKPKSPAQADGWTSLFDGRSLGKWKIVDRYEYQRHGKVDVRDGRIVLAAGSPGTGIKWTGAFPKIDYEVALEGMRVEGDDFFCGMTFPVGHENLTLVLGGWGGSVCGLSSIDGEPAVENETCRYLDFNNGRWYRVRLRVAKDKIEAWLDDQKIVDLKTDRRKFSILWEVEPTLPFGIATWNTTAAVRGIRVRPLAGQPAAKSQDSRPADE